MVLTLDTWNMHPKKYGIHALKGYCYIELGYYDEAFEAYEKAIDLNPTFAEGFLNLGYIY